MLGIERRRKIMDKLNEERKVYVSELATLFGVTRLLFAVVKVPNCPSNWLFKSVVPEKRGK